MSWKEITYGKDRVRRNYSRVPTNVELPNLIEVQTESFKWLMEKGLKDLFDELSPIKDHGDGEKFELYFTDYEFDEPKYTIAEAKMHNANYSRALKSLSALKTKKLVKLKKTRSLWVNFRS